MRRLALALVTTFVLALPFAAPAQAAPEAGTLELAGVLVFQTSGGTTHVTFATHTCLHQWAPPTDPTDVVQATGWVCGNGEFWLSGSGPAGGFVTLSGGWRSMGRTYGIDLSVLDLLFTVGPHAATGSVSLGGSSGPATLSFATTPASPGHTASYEGVLEYTLT